MKHLLMIVCCFLLLLQRTTTHAQVVVKAKTKEDKTKVKTEGKAAADKSKGAPSTMKGAYQMTAQKLNIDNRDSIINMPQFKMYTDRYFMYAHGHSSDSLGDFGIGTYKVRNGRLTEYPFFRSMDGQVSDSFELNFNRTAGGYSQVINLPTDSTGRKYILTEDYRTTSTNVSTPMDGAWKMVKRTEYAADGTPTEVPNPVQYKIFQSGNIMWANTYPDSASKKTVSSFGYGTFKMTGPNRLVETLTNSTYRTGLVGVPITLDIVFKGKDSYQQTISFPDGSKSIEVYERLK